MGPENFEDKVRKKFDGQTVKAPSGVWDSLDGVLTGELASKYATQKNQYKWLAVAAVFLALLSVGAQIFKITSDEGANDFHSYNALLSNDYDVNNFYQPFTGVNFSDLTFDRNEERNSEDPVNSSAIVVVDQSKNILPAKFISYKKPKINAANVSNSDIYRYYIPGTALQKSRNGSDSKAKIWAGVEAGAGSFNSDFGGTGTLTNSLNPVGLANALGSGNFVNPTTSVTQNMDEGVATTFGVDFGVQLGKRWTLESGLAYTSMDNSGIASINVVDVYTIDNTDFFNSSEGVDGAGLVSGQVGQLNSRDAVIEVEENYDYEVELNNSVQLASLPIKAGYFVLDKKLKLRVNAGVAANYLMEGNLSDPSQDILNSNDLNLYNDWSFDGIGGVEFGYKVWEKFDFTLEPNYRYAITPLSNSTESPARFVIQTGLRYTLK